ncbi:NifU family protein [Candidatus Uhrbacteria bacterium]|nr:MAG: NifU family protein [Candidatus Uhrbacteria bacterium]
MNAAEALEQTLTDLKPMLDAAGRAIRVLESDGTSCKIELAGFCGDCACTASYIEGIQEILAEKAPQITNIEFVDAEIIPTEEVRRAEGSLRSDPSAALGMM